ncbi:MAG: N-acetyltransferase GCN5 [Anaerolineaceae bacterium]|nr:MAG: N-acetyltransferase GCN5 [Anaerolineaceae bacterium]
MTPAFTVRPLTPADRDWVRRKMVEEWDSEIIFVHGQTFRPADLPGFAAVAGDGMIGLLTYRLDADACEIMTINSWRENRGVGSALIEAARQAAGAALPAPVPQAQVSLSKGPAGCRRLFLVTTNDNTRALRFYQKRGFTICAVRLNVMEQARKVKPEIPPAGADGIPIRDEIELEIFL